MRIIFALAALLASTTAYAEPVSSAQNQKCEAIQFEYGSWALDLRRNIKAHDTEHGGPIDSLVAEDINQGLVIGRYFMQDNIRYIEMEHNRGFNPVIDCGEASGLAKRTLNNFVRSALHDFQPSDRAGRDTLLDKLRMDFSTLTLRIQNR